MSAATLSAGLPAADPGEAAGLPGAAYTSADFLEMERRRVFRPAWIGVAPEDRVAAPGSVCPVSAAGQPLLLVRGERGELRVFHNVCRHRGTLLATAPGRCRSIVCPYHGWTCGLDGGLRETPHFEGFGAHGHGNLDPARHGLIPVRSGVWNRVVFVNLSGDAPPLDVWIAPLARRWAHFDFSLLRHGPGVSHELPVNWKTATENFLESYHLPVVHRTLNRYSALEHHNLVLESETFFGQQSTRYAPRDGAAGQLPVFPGLSDVQAGRAEYLCLFPNVWVSCVRDHFRVSFVEPVARSGPASAGSSSSWAMRRWRRGSARRGRRWSSASWRCSRKTWRCCAASRPDAPHGPSTEDGSPRITNAPSIGSCTWSRPASGQGSDPGGRPASPADPRRPRPGGRLSPRAAVRTADRFAWPWPPAPSPRPSALGPRPSGRNSGPVPRRPVASALSRAGRAAGGRAW